MFINLLTVPLNCFSSIRPNARPCCIDDLNAKINKYIGDCNIYLPKDTKDSKINIKNKLTQMKTLPKSLILEERKWLNEINNSGKYSFSETIDDDGNLHIDWGYEQYAEELGLIVLEEHLKKLASLKNIKQKWVWQLL